MPLEFAGPGAPLTLEGLNAAAGRLGCGLSAVAAVIEVETKGCGYLADRRPKILFEGHVFHRETAGHFDAKVPDLSFPKYDPKSYGMGGAHQYERLQRAMQRDHEAALRSASWGLGQIMGFNATKAGFADAPAMIAAFAVSEDAHLAGMAAFCASQHLDAPLREGRWADFARGYNGDAYKKNGYDVKLAKAFGRFEASGPPDLRLRAAQVYLMYLGHDPGPIDGRPGNRTKGALIAYAEQHGLPETGLLDDATFAHLKAAAMA